jgi:hypothetical protein
LQTGDSGVYFSDTGGANGNPQSAIITAIGDRQFNLQSAVCTRQLKWAHQDSNLGQAGYEPAALTAELWARTKV